jgi:hypothetical protein
MPTVQLTDPTSGSTKTVQLDGTPTQADLEELSGKLFGNTPKLAPTPPPSAAPISSAATPDQVMNQFGKIALDYATNPVISDIARMQGESGQNLTTLPDTQGDPILAQQIPGGGLQYRSTNGQDPFAQPGTPIAQAEKTAGGMKVRTVHNGITRIVGANGQPQWFDAQGRPLPQPPGQQLPVASPDYVGGVQEAINNAGEAVGNTLAAVDRPIARAITGAAMATPTGRLLQRVTGIKPQQAQETAASAYTTAAKDAAGVAAGVPSFTLGTAKAVGADVGAALAKDPALKAQAEQEADQFSKDFVGSIIGAPHLDPNDPNAHTGWAAQAYKAIGYLHNGDKANAWQAAQNVAAALAKGAREHPVMTVLGVAGGAAGLMGLRGHAMETLEQAKDAAEAVGDTQATEGAKQASEQIAASTSEPATPEVQSTQPLTTASPITDIVNNARENADKLNKGLQANREDVAASHSAGEAMSAHEAAMEAGTPVDNHPAPAETPKSAEPTGPTRALAPIRNKDQYAAAIRATGLDPHHVDTWVAIAEQMANQWSKETGRPTSDWYGASEIQKGETPAETMAKVQKTPPPSTPAEPVKPAESPAPEPIKEPVPITEPVKANAPATPAGQSKAETPTLAIPAPKGIKPVKGVPENTPDENGIVHGWQGTFSSSRGSKTQVRTRIQVGKPVTESNAPAIHSAYYVEAIRENPRGSVAKPKATDPIWRVYDTRAKQYVGEKATQADALAQAKGLAAADKKTLSQVNESVSSVTKGLTAKAQAHFGTTTDPFEAGYITHDGNMLDFSGRHTGDGEPGNRIYDHRDLPSELTNGKRSSEGMGEFQRNSGAVRMNYVGNGLGSGDLSAEIVKPLTPDQIGTIRKIARGGNLTLDVVDKDTGKVTSTFAADNATDAQVMRAVRSANAKAGDTLFQKTLTPLQQDNSKGTYALGKDANRTTGSLGYPGIIKLYTGRGADFSTIAHETFHSIMDAGLISKENLAALEDAVGKKYKDWGFDRLGEGDDEHERTARWFERYLRDGEAPTSALKKAFAQAKQIMISIYNAITGDRSIEEAVPPAVKAAFDRMMGKEDATSTGETKPQTPAEAAWKSYDEALKPKAGNVATTEAEPRAKTAETPKAAEKPAEPSKGVQSERVGSMNMRLFGGDKDAQAQVKEQYDRIVGLHHDTVTHEQIRELGKSLNLSYDDMKQMAVGDTPATPPGVEPKLWKAAYADAIRNLHAKAQVELVDARAVSRDAWRNAQDDPTPENKKAEEDATVAQLHAQANAEMMHEHDSAASSVAGTVLGARNMVSEGVKGEGYQGALNVPTLDEALGLPKTGRVTEAMENPKESGKGPKGTNQRGTKPKPRPSGRPARVRTTTDDERAAAIAAYKASKGPLTLAQEAEPTKGVLHQRPEADPKTEALVTLGKYHYEKGLRDFSEHGANSQWQKAVEADTGDKLTPEQAQWVHQLTKNDLARTVRDKQTAALTPLFVDHLSGELGRKGATQMLTDVGDDVRNRLIRGDAPESYTPDEKQAIADAYDKNQPKPRNPTSKQAATTAKQIATDLRAPKAKAGPPKTLDTILRARVKGGMDSVVKIKADLASDALGQSALDKLKTGDEMTVAEERRLARAIDTYRKTTPKTNRDELTTRITKLVSDARRGRLGYDSPLEAARAQMLADANKELEALPKGADAAKREKVQETAEAKAKAINTDLAKISDEHDTEAIAKVLMKHSDLSKWNQVDQYVLGNILSSPDTAEKIMVSHPSTVAAEEMRRWLFGDRSEIPGGIKAGVAGVKARGIPEAKAIMKTGSTAANLGGTAWYKPLGGRIPVESKLWAWRQLLRAHSAYYQLMQTYNVERGLHLMATEDGKAKGLTGQALDDHVNDVLTRPERYRSLAEKAIAFGEEETQTSPNPIAKIISQLAGQYPALKAIKTTLLPVANLPLNALQRTLEAQTGLLTSRAMARMYARLHPDATPEEVTAYRDKVFQRGAVGAGIAGLSALLAYKGIITPSDPEHHRYTARINAFGHSVDVPAGSVGAVMDTGASLEQDLKNRDFMRLHEQIMNPWIADNPILRAANTLTGAAGAISGNAQDQSGANRAVGGVISEYQPMSGATGFAAKAIDAAKGQARKAPNLPFPLGALATPAGNVPGLRQRVYPIIKGKQGQTARQAILHMMQAEPPGQIARENAENVAEDRKKEQKMRDEWRKLEAAVRR